MGAEHRASAAPCRSMQLPGSPSPGEGSLAGSFSIPLSRAGQVVTVVGAFV